MTKTAILVNGLPIDYSSLPEHMQDGMRLYLENRIGPGSFLTSVLANDLRGACERADHINRYRLYDIVSWLYNYAPGNSWGSRESVNKWLTGGQKHEPD